MAAGAAVVGIAALAWIALYGLVRGMDMPGMDEADMAVPPWSVAGFVLDFAMWLTMMVGMMLPGALPVILLYRRIAQDMAHPALRLAVFVLAYLAAWAIFSLAATAAQEILQQWAWVTLMSVRAVPVLAMLILALAGIYQFLPLKDACLASCRSPISFLQRHSLRTVGDGWRTGFAHGLYCVGCCWALMLVLFAVGAMNMLWAAALGVLVLLEKITHGVWVSHASGWLLIGAAAWIGIVQFG